MLREPCLGWSLWLQNLGAHSMEATQDLVGWGDPSFKLCTTACLGMPWMNLTPFFSSVAGHMLRESQLSFILA